MTNIIFVRHAQSVYGEDDRTRPLSEAGLKDREIVLDTLKDGKIDAFLSSPYKRSIDTIKPASEHFGMDIITDERLRERKAGSYEEGLLEKRWQDFSFAEECGECLNSVQKRNIEALTDILDKYKGKTIVIGTHGTALSTILHHYNNDFGVKDFLRIVNWMPYIVELRFNNNELVELIELAHVDKG
ncbi:MAG: histidine phosphatase family protein [Lachnospiraceae bacterium]|nr:histidine phosphatase family protein [Lachnospiraceae bacterium]